VFVADLGGKVALITGAGQGIGQGIALALAASGAKIVAAGRTRAKLEDTVALIAERGGEALAVAGDVTNAGDLAAMVEATIARFGALDILVNNAQQAPMAACSMLQTMRSWEGSCPVRSRASG
jgi:NAD(P)-dependent dehydrogenase (short-subunit alcohol dehydrogenase family)